MFLALKKDQILNLMAMERFPLLRSAPFEAFVVCIGFFSRLNMSAFEGLA